MAGFRTGPAGDTSGDWPWKQENSFGLRVTDIEAAGQRAFPVYASCAGTSTSYAGDCTRSPCTPL
jgi:hypothetical protein